MAEDEGFAKKRHMTWGPEVGGRRHGDTEIGFAVLSERFGGQRRKR